MYDRNYNGQLGAGIADYMNQGAIGNFGPTETVINGVTYRTENGKVYRKQNGQLIPVTNPQELLALDRQYNAPPTTGLYPIGGNNPDSGSSSAIIVLGVVGLAFLLLSRR